MIPASAVREVNGGSLDWLVYGMTWEHVSGARPERRSLQRAKARKATHYVAAHEGSSAVGLARLATPAGKVSSRKSRRYTSAGALFASRRPKGIYVAQLDLGEVTWLIACHDGVVIPGFDLVLDGADEVNEAITRLRERHKDAHLVEIPAFSSDDVKNTLQGRLALVKTSAQAIPTWMKVSAVVLLGYGLYSEGQSWWDEYRAEQELVQNPAQQFDFNVERAKQLDTWQNGIHLDGPEGLRNVLQQIGSLPKGFGGWTLATGVSMAAGVSTSAIACGPNAAGWVCTALYSRTALGTNESFRSGFEHLKSRVEGQCAIGWIDLEKAQLACQFDAQRHSLDRMAVDRAEAINLMFIPQVQRVMLAFREVKIDPRTAVSLANPVVINSRGDRISLAPSGPQTPQAQLPGKQVFSYSGPLRSLTVLPLTHSSVITHIDVQRLDVTDPTLNTSALRAEVKGEMYVK